MKLLAYILDHKDDKYPSFILCNLNLILNVSSQFQGLHIPFPSHQNVQIWIVYS